jgi:ubiquinone/menaquinone biosynthesis C-methylase UbiE
MDPAVYRSAQAKGREPVNQIGSRLESSDVMSSDSSDFPSVATACVSVQEGYERWAPTYDYALNPLLNLEERKLTALLPDLRGKRILDLACGTGRWLEKFSAQGARLEVGVDSSAAMLGIAGKKAEIRGQLARADCLRLPFRSSVFDLVVCSFALGHIRDLGVMVRELAQVTERGADVFVSDLHAEAYARGWRTGFRDSCGPTQIEIVPRTAEEVILAFFSAGFECLTHVPLCLGEPEKSLFAQAGKSHLFSRACQVPAVLVCHFRLTSAATESRGGA